MGKMIARIAEEQKWGGGGGGGGDSWTELTEKGLEKKLKKIKMN